LHPTAQKVLFLAVITGILAVFWQAAGGNRNQQKVPEISYSDFLSGVEEGRVLESYDLPQPGAGKIPRWQFFSRYGAGQPGGNASDAARCQSGNLG
jgi:hypothetical protein